MNPMPEMSEIVVTSTVDGSDEPALLWVPQGTRPCPLVVGLHTWSADRFNQVEAMLPQCTARGWALLLPEFRGANTPGNPRALQAAGSEPARQDILDAVEAVTDRYAIDREHVFLVGGSGGGHMALMMAGTAPRAFTAVSAWCPITDVAAWHEQNPRYRQRIEACMGGPPGASPEVDRRYHDRSPINHTATMARATLSVHHGRGDTSVPWRHTWELACAVLEHDPSAFYVELFDGGHEIHLDRAFAWFDGFVELTDGGELTG